MGITFDWQLWLLSIGVAMIGCFTALHLVQRAASHERMVAHLWVAAGALAMGMGISSTHFVGTMAMGLPIALTDDLVRTCVSVGIATAVSWLAFALVSGPTLTVGRLIGAGFLLGGGISALHFTAADAAIIGNVRVTYDVLPSTITAAMAVAAVIAGFWLVFNLRPTEPAQNVIVKIAAAAVMGSGTCILHYFGMEAVPEPNSRAIDTTLVSLVIVAITLGTMCLAVFIAAFDSSIEALTKSHTAELEKASEELQRQGSHDKLTGLLNRTVLDLQLREMVLRYERLGDAFAVMTVDLDKFNDINSMHGFRAGDQVLKSVADRLTHALRTTDKVLRVGDDEFVVLLPKCPRDGATIVLPRLVSALAKPHRAGEIDIRTTASIGVAIYPQNAASIEEVLQRSNEALVEAKKQGHGTCRFFEPEMTHATVEERVLLNSGAA